MLAIILFLLLPIALIFIAKRYQNNGQMSKGEMLLRYIVYIVLLLFASYIILTFMKDDNTSFFEKVNQSLQFAIKFTVLEVIMALGIAVVEWLLLGKKLAYRLDWSKFTGKKPVQFVSKYICPFLIYVLAALVIVMNVSLMFDNVVWGDEAFSASTAKESLYGIMQIMYFWDNHPPLHYFWTKLFGEIFGHTVPVYHLAALVPFIIGIILAVTAFRKRFGNIPAAFFVMISGLGAACLEYNLEIRMYSLAFFGVLGAFYCSYKVISTGKRSAWVGMVLWALVAAYSHYYALVAVGILLFCNGVAVWLKHRGKTWLKGFCSIIAFLLGYAPWLFFLFTAVRNVSNNWWMTDLLGLDKSLNMVMGSDGLSTFVLPLLLLMIAALLLFESSIFRFGKTEDSDQNGGKEIIRVTKPSVKGWSDETYAVVVGLFTIIGTLTFAYLLCLVMGPVLAERYLYPLSAVTYATLVVAAGRVIALLKKCGEAVRLTWLEAAGKAVLTVFLALFLLIGLGNYKDFSTLVKEQDAKTNATLELIGEPAEDVQMITNGVKHLGWTVLDHYFPGTDIITGDYRFGETGRFWYFSPYALYDDQLESIRQSGYEVSSYGEMQLSQYPFELYYMEKVVSASSQVQN